MNRALAEYRRKRDFRATPEPGERAGRGKRNGSSYVIQLHHARRKHYDFRLEVNGTLRSWAVPKGPSLDPGAKRLAVEVEDHPLDYAEFEGDIPQGHYGAGHVDIWDRGRWTLDLIDEKGDAERQLKAGHLHFHLDGERLSGAWSLVRTRAREKQPQWLLMKKSDESAIAGDEADERPLRQAVASKPGKQRRASRADFPETVGLQLARLSEHVPAGDDWYHEVKYDGYRILIFRNGDELRISSRNGEDYTDKLPAVLKAVRALPCKQCIVDGELVALTADGRSSFDLLQQRFNMNQGAGLEVMLFDLLWLDGEDRRDEPQHQRRAALEKLLRKPKAPLHLSSFIQGDGKKASAYACEHGLEGIISKSRSAPYREGRHGEWLKIKCTQSDEFVIVGYTEGQGAREQLGSLLLARPDGKGRQKTWQYVGRVGSGLTEESIRDLLKRFKKQAEPVELKSPPSRADLKGARVTWVQPDIVAEVVYRAITSAGILRQASLKGIRRDKSVADVLSPDTVMPIASKKDARIKPGQRISGNRNGDEIKITHPERVVYKKDGITKGEVAQFYRDISPWLLPEIAGRPLAMLRCPDGTDSTCFFQKHRNPGFGEAVKDFHLKADGRNYIYIDDQAGLMNLVQMNIIEFHPWGAMAEAPEKPDRIVMDLDPGPGVAWKDVVKGCWEVKEILDGLKLQSFVRTSGGKGLHVVLPLDGRSNWDAVKNFAHAIASMMTQQNPKKYIDTATKSKRRGRIFVDYLRNGRGATAIASYALRARQGAPVAMPLDWKDLARLKSGAQFNFGNALQHLKKRKRDPWEELRELRQSLPRIQ